MVDYQRFADTLLKDGFLLTALEFHTELMERGRTLKILQKFFEDSSNFETFTRKLDKSPAPSISSMAGSQANLDELSLFDVTRYSEDSHLQPDDRVAVLEFELRKARETIHSLRDELTQQAMQYAELLRANSLSGSGRSRSTSGVCSTNDSSGLPSLHLRPTDHLTSETLKRQSHSALDDASGDEDEDDDDDGRLFPGIQKHEQRTLNYLVNEYLLQHNYKLTSITFSDENSEEDFEDWDSIGLNVAKPPNLLRLFRDFKRHVIPSKVMHDIQIQTLPDQQLLDLIQKNSTLDEEVLELNRVIEDQTSVVNNLKDQLKEVESKFLQLETESRKSEADFKFVQQFNGESDANDNEEVANVQNFCRESIPQSFVDFMFVKCSPEIAATSNMLIVEDSCEKFEDAIAILSDCLPKIVPNVLLSKRDELIPLLLMSIQYNKSEKTRDELLHLLFNLIKRPDENQRQIILSGFKKIAQIFPDRIECELMPQIWEQISHKYVERRILIAETCKVLLPFTPGPLRNSLVYSILNQLISDDRDVQVRMSAINAMSLLVLSMREPDKWGPLFDLLLSLLKDPALELVECVQQKLLPPFALWSLELDRLESILVTNRLEDLSQHCDLIKGLDDNITSDANSKQSIQNIVLAKLETLKILLPFVIKSVIDGATITSKVCNPTQEPSEDILEVLLSDERWKVAALKDFLCREWYEPWPQLQWFTATMVPHILSCIGKIPISISEKVVLKFAFIIRRIATYLGPGFVQTHLASSFSHLLPLLSSAPESMFSDEPRSSNELFLYTESGLVPSYFLGVLGNNSATDQADILRQWSVIYCMYGFPTASLSFILKHLFLLFDPRSDQLHDCRDAISEMAWSLVVHSSTKLRCFSGKILELLVESSARANDNLISTKILPGLITLSSDTDTIVRVASVAGLAKVITLHKTPEETREKSCFQLMSYVDAGQLQHRPAEHEIRIEVVRHLSNIIPAIRASDSLGLKLRDEVLLPKLADLNFTYSSLHNDDSSKSSGCLEMFATILGAYKSIVAITTAPSDDDLPKLPLHVIQVHIVPSLQKLASDFRRVSPAQESSALQLIGQLEAAYGRTFVLHLPVETAAAVGQLSTGGHPHTTSLMTPSPSMDEMKQRVGKIFQKNAQSFWKK